VPHTFRNLVSAAQCRAARALLQWSQDVLAIRAGVARKTVADFERSNRTLHRRTRLEITVALEAAGVRFIWDADGSLGGEGAVLTHAALAKQGEHEHQPSPVVMVDPRAAARVPALEAPDAPVGS
jgi:transcriptional regulator with XRE-family HTH domain